MDDLTIREFLRGIDRVLKPSGHLFLWVDKFHLCEGVKGWFSETDLKIVDMITWHKGRMGMGYRSRRTCEYLLVLQKTPCRAKWVWIDHTIPDVWNEEISSPSLHPHQKPLHLIRKLIFAVTNWGELVVDPAAGSFVVLEACKSARRTFLGCDIKTGEFEF